MKIVADENMAAVEELFSAFGEIHRRPGREMSPALLADADALLVRSVTPVDAPLLAGSRVKFVGSATIGTDHVDLEYLRSRGIGFASAPGCNALAVVNYVLAALSRVEGGWLDKTVGIIGCGNVGGRLYRALKTLGVNCRCYDPFLDPDSFLDPHQQSDLCSFEETLAADILCLHTPLTHHGPHPTRHLFDAAVLASLKTDTLLLNAGRGGVIDGSALKAELRRGRLRAVLDVWEHEPAIDPELLSLVNLGTPHIAGYSLEGRVRGTAMVYEAFCRWLGTAPAPVDVGALADRLAPTGVRVGEVGLDHREGLPNRLLAAYDPAVDHRRLLACGAEGDDIGLCFDRLRKHYPYRREFT